MNVDKVKNMQDIWDNGVVSHASLSGEEIDLLKQRTNATRVVYRRWVYQEKSHQTTHGIRLLPDQSGFVYYENDDPLTKRIVVLNGNNTLRLIIGVPRVDANSVPEDGYLALPPSSARFGGIEWGCEGNDGHTDYLFNFDWTTGRLLNFARPTRPW